MQTHDEDVAQRARTLIAAAIVDEGGVKDLAIKAKVSEATLRRMANTGLVTSHVVAASLEHATDGRIRASEIEQPDAKGRDLYGREPARTILSQALARGTSVTSVLGSYGISHHDLWSYMNHDANGSEAVRRRVGAALDHAGIAREEKA